MRSIIPSPVVGVVSLTAIVLNTLFFAVPLFSIAIVRLIVPGKTADRLCSRVLGEIALCWIACNNLNIKLTKRINWDVRGDENLDPRQWYLVICNHQSWVDILVLQYIFHRKIPFLKFFLKRELIWVPILGLAWWALDFPFMRRYSEAFLQKHPELKGKDLEITRKACEKFSSHPVSVMNFVEGTRFSPEKHLAQNSPFKNLLRPRAGGVGFVVSAMDRQLTHILDVTIVYPGCRNKSMWYFLCGGVTDISVTVDVIPLDGTLKGDYIEDSEFRQRFQDWLNDRWERKDLEIESLLAASMDEGRLSVR